MVNPLPSDLPESLQKRLASLSPEKRELLIRKYLALRVKELGISVSDDDDGPCPLSFQQERFWVMEQWTPGASGMVTSHAAYLVSGSLDQTILNQAWKLLTVRHESLRTIIQKIDGGPVQQVLTPSESQQEITEIDVAGMTPEQALSCLETDIQRLIFPENRPGVQPFLYRMSPEKQILLIATRHVFTDGWTKMILLKDLLYFYQSLLSGEPNPLPELPVQYRDYARWQQSLTVRTDWEPHLCFWKNYLKDIPTLELPLDMKRPPLQRWKGKSYSIPIGSNLETAVHQTALSANSTDFIVWMAAFQLLLFRYSNQELFAIGTPVSGRTELETEEMAGLFMNPLALKADLSGNPTFLELVSRVKANFLSVISHQTVPFHQVVEMVQPPRDPSRTPIFQVLFHQRKFPPVTNPVRELTVEPLAFDPGTSEFDLSLELVNQHETPVAWFQYDTALFQKSTIARIAHHFKNIVQNAMENPNQPVSEIPLMDEAEKKLCARYSEGPVPVADSRTLNRIISDVAMEFPNEPALVKEGRTVSYGQLEEESSRIAGAIRKEAGEAAQTIGLSMAPELPLFTTIVGILKAGCAYVPIDPLLPQQRKQFIASDTGISLLISDDLKRDICWHPEMSVRTVSSLLKMGNTLSPDETCNDPGRLAYIMYTSGSTGRPKGVMVTHRNVVNYSKAKITAFFHDHPIRSLQFASISYDMSVDEIFPALISGSTLILKTSKMNGSIASFLNSCELQRVTHMTLPTSFFHELAISIKAGVHFPKDIKCIVFGGDRANPELVRACQKILKGKVAIWNAYGPTETTVITTYGDFSLPESLPEWMDEVPVGKPISGYRVAVVDRKLRPVPLGVPGELIIGGAGVSRGYLNLPEETAERFLPDPSFPGYFMYRTGDWGRFLNDGRIQFLGRIDNQVKVRGFRVEPGEIESALIHHPDVAEATVTAPPGSDGNRHLIAWIVPKINKQISPDNIEESLREKLPAYLIPEQFQFIETIPKTRGGKPDIQQLNARQPHTRPKPSKQPIVTDTEKRITEIWEQTLNLTMPLFADDNFFDLGGHSLAAIRVLGAIEREWGRRILMEQLFLNPTVAGLAQLIDKKETESKPKGILEIREGGNLPPIFLIPPAGTPFSRFKLLSKYLSENRPVLALQPAGLHGETTPLSRMEDIVARYTELIHSRVGNQPFWIGGSCFGAHVAMELHHALIKKGIPPMGAILLDPRLSSLHGGPAFKQTFLKRLFQVYRFIYWKIKRIRIHFTMRLTRERRQILNVWQASGQALKNFQHNPLANDTYVLLSERKRYADPIQRFRWSELGASDNCLHVISGTDHGDLITPAHVEEVADILDRIMGSKKP